MSQCVHILYFASLRERVGTAAEDLPIDRDTTVTALLDRLRQRDGQWADALGAGERILVAVNQELARPETLLRAGDEVAFFPPVTGG